MNFGNWSIFSSAKGFSPLLNLGNVLMQEYLYLPCEILLLPAEHGMMKLLLSRKSTRARIWEQTNVDLDQKQRNNNVQN